MTINEQILQTMNPFGLPVTPEVDTMHRERCITFNYTLVPVQFADNRPVFYKALIQIHLFLPLSENSIPLRRDILRALAGGGFAWPEIVDACDEECQHFVFETETLTKTEG